MIAFFTPANCALLLRTAGIFPENSQLTHAFSRASEEIPVITCFSLFRLQENLLVFLRKGSLVRVSLQSCPENWRNSLLISLLAGRAVRTRLHHPPASPYSPVIYELNANFSQLCGLSRVRLTELGPESYPRLPVRRERVAFSLIGTFAVRFRAQFSPENIDD